MKKNDPMARRNAGFLFFQFQKTGENAKINEGNPQTMNLKDPKNIFFGAIGLFIVLAAVAAVFLFAGFRNDGIARARICFKDSCLMAEIADTPEARRKGLMMREKLGKGEGMLFMFESEGSYSFWMKDTLIPLDIIWLDDSLRAVHIETAQPCRSKDCPKYVPAMPAKYVLETNAGFAEKKGVSIGDVAIIN